MSLLGECYSDLIKMFELKHKSDLEQKDMVAIMTQLHVLLQFEDYKSLNEIVERFFIPASSANVMVLLARTLFKFRERIPSYERNLELCVKEINCQGRNAAVLFHGLLT